MAMPQILDEPLGSEITILTIQRYQPWKHHGGEKSDVIFIVYKDAKGIKKVKEIVDPPMEIFFVKPEHRTFRTPREYLDENMCYSKVVPYSKVLHAIYQEVCISTDPISQGFKRLYEEAIETGNHSAKRELYRWPYVLFSDLSPEDYYLIQLGLQYNTIHPHSLTQAFLDIENDVAGLSTTEIEAHEGPTNAVTLIIMFQSTNNDKQPKAQSFTFLLRNYKLYPEQREVEKNIDRVIDKLHSQFDSQEIIAQGDRRTIKFPCDYHIIFYDSEEELISAVFTTINHFKPDFCNIYNIAYDLPTLRDRAEKLGVDFKSLICDHNYPESLWFYEFNIDRRPVEIFDRKTNIKATTTTLYSDSMQNYHGKRKGRKAQGSSSLDNTCKNEMGLGKLQFTEPGVNAGNAARYNYEIFTIYNITDVVRTAMLEMITNDVLSMVIDMNQSFVMWENLFKQTKHGRQMFAFHYLKRKFIPGNNSNINYIRGYTEDSALNEDEISKQNKIAQLKAIKHKIDVEAGAMVDEDDEDESDDDIDLALASIGEAVDVYKDSIKIKHGVVGAIIGNPDLNSNNGIELVNGIKSKTIFVDVIDYDYTAEYPWGMYARSVSRSTQIGRLVIFDKISDRQNSVPEPLVKRDRDKRQYIPGAEFVSDLISDDILSMGNVWFNLPTTEEMSNILTASISE